MSLDLRPKTIAINRLGNKIIPRARRSVAAIFSAGIAYLITSARAVEPPNNFAIKMRLAALESLDFSIGNLNGRDQLLGIQ